MLWLAQFFKPVDEVTQDEALTGLRDTLLAERRLGAGRHEHHEHGHADAPKHDARHEAPRDRERRATTAMQSYEFEPIGTGTSSCTSTSMRTSTTMRDAVPTM